MKEDQDTIFAVATGMGKSAVAVVRVSGSACDEILDCFCPGVRFKDRQATLVELRNREGALLDRALVIRFLAPRSFTGEDMIEFQTTGSRAIVTELLAVLGCFNETRMAEPGEFARRAFENGKIDLIEVEGLAATVEAETQAQLRQAHMMASGSLSRQCEVVRALLLQALANIESLLDFSDVEDTSEIDMNRISGLIRTAKDTLTVMLERSGVSERLRDGMIVAVAGRPNVGKSTLVNYLASRDVAIVSPLPGTTRDALEIALEIEGYPIILVDTAGLRETADPLEREGINRARNLLKRADVVLWLSDDDAEWNAELRLDAALQKVRTKVDDQNQVTDDGETISISAATGSGIKSLIDRIARFARSHFAEVGQPAFCTERQQKAAGEALSALDGALRGRANGIELVAAELRFAADALGRISGRIGVEEVLDEIFSRLCVGK